MLDGWEPRSKVRSSSFFYQNMTRRASEKMNKFPCSSRRCLVAMQRGNGHCYMESSFLYSGISRGYINHWPCPRVRPSGTLPSGHAGRYSSCHCPRLPSRSQSRSRPTTLTHWQHHSDPGSGPRPCCGLSLWQAP